MTVAFGARPSNPFCTRLVRPGAIEYQFAGVDDHSRQLRCIALSLAEHCRGGRLGGQITGPHGSGKSTLLESLIPHLGRQDGEIVRTRFSLPHETSTPSKVTGSTPLPVGRWVDRWVGRWAHRRNANASARRHASKLAPGGLLVIDGAEQLGRVGWWRLLRQFRRQGKSILVTSHRPLPGIAVLHQTSVDAAWVRRTTLELVRQTAPQLVDSADQHLRSIPLGDDTNVRDLWFDMYEWAQHRIPNSFVP